MEIITVVYHKGLIAGGSESIARAYRLLVPAVFATVTFPVAAAAGTFTFIKVSVQTVALTLSVESTFSPFGNVTKLVDALVEPKAVLLS